jgi:hypothetical protein
MNEFRELSDLPPGPRPTPTRVLWMMAAVILVGGVALITAEPADKRLAATHPQAKANQVKGTRASFAAAASSRSPGH